MSRFLAYIMLHEMMHAMVMTSAQNYNRWIGDMAMQVHEYEQQKGNLYVRKPVVMNVYGPEACKILARTVRMFIAKD
jgi:hypothetical protein